MNLIAFALLILPVFLSQYEPIETFGLLTVTHSRNGDYSVLEKYLERYTMTECYTQFLSEINLIWNNQQLPEQSNLLKNRHKWKVPVYFFRTTFNSMDHRYRLPKESTAQLLYSLDDDIIVDCQTFKATLQRYNQANSKTQLGRVTTNQVRAFGYDPNKGMEFFYQGHPTAIYFTIAEPGAAFIPRHYLDLYYLKLQELQYLHNIVLDVKNCDDIFFWAIVQHFYPELPAVYMKGQKNYKNTDPKVGQSKSKNVYVVRNKCINNISHALGYNSLRHFHKNSTRYLELWQYPNLDLILAQKTAGLNAVSVVPSEEKVVPEELKNKWEKGTVPKIAETKPAEPVKIPGPVKKPEPAKLEPAIKKKEQLPEKGQVINEAPKQEIKPQSQVSTQTSSQSQKNNSIPQQHPKNSEHLITPSIQQPLFTFPQKVGALLAFIIILSVVLYKVNQRRRRASDCYRTRLQDYDEQQMMNTSASIRLPDHY